MAPLLANYFPILVFLVIAGVIAVAMVGGSLVAARQKPYAEKLSAYECGFEPFDDARRRVRRALLSRRHPVHHLRPGSGVPVPLGGEPGAISACSASGR